MLPKNSDETPNEIRTYSEGDTRFG
jgi:hypothetical protein